MADKTEQKIMDAALKIFAKYGYKGATTRAIADEAGFNELTLFRRFKNKENLYNTVLTENVEKMLKDYEKSVFIDKKFENPRDFLETYIKNTLNVMMNNFEVFYLAVNEENKVLGPIMDETIHFIGKYFEKNIPGKNIDYETFGFTINSFIYVINLERYHGRTSSFGKSYEETLENAIDLLYCMVNQ